MQRFTLIALVAESVLVVLGLVGGRLIATPLLETARVDLQAGVVALAASLPAALFVVWSMRTSLAIFVRLRRLVREHIAPLVAGCSRTELVLIAIMAGVGEEVFFRGLLQGSLARFVAPWIAVALVGVVFGLAHAVSLDYAVVTSLVGIYLGTLMLATGNILVPVVVHALFDVVALLLIARMAPLSTTPEAGRAGGDEPQRSGTVG